MAATNVQAFPGDVTISSNLAVDTNTLFVDSVGNRVGIGTDAPESLLHLSAATASADITDPIKLKIHNRKLAADWSITQPWGLLEFDTDDTGTAGRGPVAGIGCRFETSSGGDSSICFYTDAATGNDTVLGAANERMCIDSDGLVGIGTSNPQQKMHIHEPSGGQVVLAITNTDTGSTNNSGLHIGLDGSENGFLFHKPNTDFIFATNNTERMRIDSDGNVGIGTNAPESILHLSAATASADITDPIKLKIHNRTGAENWSLTQPWGLLEFDTNDSGTAGHGPVAGIGCRFETANGGDSSICFYTDNATGNDTVLGSANERMCIDSDGNVGIGTNAPGSLLHVNGDVRMKTLSTNVIGKVTAVYARGTGFNNNANRLVKIGDVTVVNTDTIGLTLTIINASTHAHVSSTNYNTYASGSAANSLATALEGMSDTQIGILTSADAFENEITANLVTAALKLGLTRLVGANDDSNRHPYVAIFYGPGAAANPGNQVLEVMKSDAASGAHATLSTFLVDDSFIGQAVTNALYSGTADSTTPTVFVDRYANVGIGTTTPGAPLEVHGPDITGDVGLTSLISRSVAGNDGVLNIFGVKQTNGEETLGLQTQIDNRAWATDIAGGWASGTASRYALVLQPYKGRVGIGTTDPDYDLDVMSDAATIRLACNSGANDRVTTLSSWATFGGSPGDTALRRTTDIQSGFTGIWGTEYLSFRVGNGAGATNDGGALTTDRMRITNNGFVGIGQTNPGAKLDIYGGDMKMSQNNSYATDRYLYTHWSDGNNDHQIGMKFDYYTGSGGTGPEHSALHFVSNAGLNQAINGSSARTMMTVRSVGTIGINQTTPLHTLDVNGTIRCGTNGRMLNSYMSVPYGAWASVPLGGSRGSYLIVAAGTSNDQACAIFTACSNSNNNAGSITTQQSNNDYNRNSYIDRRYAASTSPQLIISGSQGYTRTCSVTTIMV